MSLVSLYSHAVGLWIDLRTHVAFLAMSRLIYAGQDSLGKLQTVLCTF